MRGWDGLAGRPDQLLAVSHCLLQDAAGGTSSTLQLRGALMEPPVGPRGLRVVTFSDKKLLSRQLGGWGNFPLPHFSKAILHPNFSTFTLSSQDGRREPFLYLKAHVRPSIGPIITSNKYH